MGRIRIGTSGWHYAHWRGVFYPPGVNQWLSYYAARLSCTEINNTFYRLPAPATVADWMKQTPRDFVFAVKAWRVITHRKKLKDCGHAVEEFLRTIQPLQRKLGPILFQLPPRWHCNPQRLADFMTVLPRGYRYAFEFRDHSWHCREVYDLLNAHGAAFCIYDLEGFLSPLVGTGGFDYIRLHGPEGAYCGKYHGNALRGWQCKAQAMAARNRDVYIFFDNDEAGYAVENAVTLRGLIESAP
jgi:uncharacterized protein YecE (DUF72 family)